MWSNHHRMFGRVYLAIDQDGALDRDESAFDYISVDQLLQHKGVCGMLGPMHLSAIYHFCKNLDTQIDNSTGKLTALTTDITGSAKTSVVFLLGAYMILMLDMETWEVAASFQFLESKVSRNHQDYWEALEKAKALEWVGFGPEGFDADEYAHYESPCNADMHVIIPNKILAMKGPVAMPAGQRWRDTPEGSRSFSVEHCAEMLADFDVKLVVRLNHPSYNGEAFEQHGIAVADLFVEECTVPSSAVVVKFLLILENLPGVAAVHCTSGLGRTGTLIALYLMKNFAFTARQAIAWLRMVRPGSVIGQQQQYLCAVEASIARLRGHPLSGPYAVPPPPGSHPATLQMSSVRTLVAKVLDRVETTMRLAPPHPRDWLMTTSFRSADSVQANASLGDGADTAHAASFATHVRKAWVGRHRSESALFGRPAVDWADGWCGTSASVPTTVQMAASSEQTRRLSETRSESGASRLGAQLERGERAYCCVS